MTAGRPPWRTLGIPPALFLLLGTTSYGTSTFDQLSFYAPKTWLHNEGAHRFGAWVFGHNRSTRQCGPHVVFVTSWPFVDGKRDWGEYFRPTPCGAVLFIDGEREFDARGADARVMRGLPESVHLLYVGNREGLDRATDTEILTPRIVTKRVRRRVVEVFWPFAFSGLVERKNVRASVADLGRPNGTLSHYCGVRRAVIGYMAQNCAHTHRDTLFISICAELEATPVSCEAFSKCPPQLGRNVVRNKTGVQSRQYAQYIDNTVQRYADCDYVLAVDEGARQGYVSEKIVSAYIAGAVPIFSGSGIVSRLFNSDSFIDANSGRVADIATEITALAAAPARLAAMHLAAPLTLLGRHFLLDTASANARRLRDALVILFNTTSVSAQAAVTPSSVEMTSGDCNGTYSIENSALDCAPVKAPVVDDPANDLVVHPTSAITNPLQVILIHSPEHFAERTAHTKRLLQFFREHFGIRYPTLLPGVYYHPDLSNADAGCSSNGTFCHMTCRHNRRRNAFGLHLLGCGAAHRNAWARIAGCPGFTRPGGGYYGPSHLVKPPGCVPLRQSGACIVEPRACFSGTSAPQNQSVKPTPTTPYTIVFEDDAAVPTLPSINTLGRITRIFQTGVRAGADIIYLGHCGKFPAQRGSPMNKTGFSCTHAYAVTTRGAELLVANTHSCNAGLAGEEAIDWAMIRYCQKNADFFCYGGESVIIQDKTLPSTIHPHGSAPNGKHY